MMIWCETETGGGVIAITVPNGKALLSDLARCFEEGEGFSVATLNLDHVVKLSHDPTFRNAYAEQTHVTADGNPIVWLSRLAGQREVTLVPGSELIDPVAALAAEKEVPIALFGSTEESLRRAARVLELRHRGLVIKKILAPPMNFDPVGAGADRAIQDIKNSGARLVLLALGAPKQEIFAARAQAALPGVGFLSIGAGLDFIAGKQKRAPQFVRALAAEWLWRILSDPKRLAARYWACFLALPVLTSRAIAARRRNRDAM